MESLLKINKLKAGYGNIQILNGINLDVKQGQIITLLGGNGTGKSTLIKSISGLIRPFTGSINFSNQDITSFQPHNIVKLGLVQVTQGKEVFPEMTVEENLKLGAFTRKNKNSIEDSLYKVFTYFPVLKEKRKQQAAILSGGQLQMLCIGRGLMSKPKMIMLDEPSAGLAPQVVLDIFKIINHIRKDGLTVLLIEQNVRLALLLADYGYIIRDGIIHLEGKAEDLVHDDKVRLSYLGGTVAETEH
jgi:branched-chain amino acid transport system ATP-binding protein